MSTPEIAVGYNKNHVSFTVLQFSPEFKATPFTKWLNSIKLALMNMGYIYFIKL